MQINIREDSVEISGYVNAVERNSKPLMSRLGKFVERIRKGAFSHALQRSEEVFLLLNHDKSRVLGSTKQGNLELTEDNIGLHARATVTDPEVIESARNGDLVGWSFGFYDTPDGVESGIDEETKLPLRKLRDLDLREVSILDRTKSPAYDGTLIMARSEDDVEYYSEPYSEEPEERFNPYHDAETGQFASKGGGGFGGGTTYNGHAIEQGIYGGNEYTVQYDGDDVFFDTIEEAKAFIDEVYPKSGKVSWGVPLTDGKYAMNAKEKNLAKTIIKNEQLDLQIKDEKDAYGNLVTSLVGDEADYAIFKDVWDMVRPSTKVNRDYTEYEEAIEQMKQNRFNPNHDGKTGRFAPKGSGSSGGKPPFGGTETTKEVLAVSEKLNNGGKATTTNKEVADMYAQNNHSEYDYEVTKSGDAYNIKARPKRGMYHTDEGYVAFLSQKQADDFADSYMDILDKGESLWVLNKGRDYAVTVDSKGASKNGYKVVSEHFN